jgi:hypothetical protein
LINRLIILFLFVQALYAAPGKLVVAVGTFESNGVPASDVNILVDRLRNELMNTGTFRVMERGMMDEILREQAFQQSGTCNTSECQVQVGLLLGVDRMVVGSIGLLGGSIYTVSARILDVATGEMLKTVSEDYQGNIAGVLSQAMPRVASKLASNHAGASVWLDHDSSGTSASSNSTTTGSYKTVTIGTQTWMAQNLNVGTMVLGSASFANQAIDAAIEKYCYIDTEANCITDGGGTSGPRPWHCPILATVHLVPRKSVVATTKAFALAVGISPKRRSGIYWPLRWAGVPWRVRP